jgi:hypothetical protein
MDQWVLFNPWVILSDVFPVGYANPLFVLADSGYLYCR